MDMPHKVVGESRKTEVHNSRALPFAGSLFGGVGREPNEHRGGHRGVAFGYRGWGGVR